MKVVTMVTMLVLLGALEGAEGDERMLYDYSCKAADLGKLRVVDDLQIMGSVTSINTQAQKGRLEVCLYNAVNGTYQFGTVCDDNFDDNDAYYMCKALPYGEYGNGVAYGRDSNKLWNVGLNAQPSFLDEIDCNVANAEAEDPKWYQCGYDVDGQEKIVITDGTTQVTKGKPKTNCNHKEDVFIQCTNALYCYTCDATSYDLCTALELEQVKCAKGQNACHRKVSETLAGVVKVTQGCLPSDEPDCTKWYAECNANPEMKLCYCNHCSISYCNSLFQQMTLDIALYATSYGELIEWILANFSTLMRIVMFDLSAVL